MERRIEKAAASSSSHHHHPPPDESDDVADSETFIPYSLFPDDPEEKDMTRCKGKNNRKRRRGRSYDDNGQKDSAVEVNLEESANKGTTSKSSRDNSSRRSNRKRRKHHSVPQQASSGKTTAGATSSSVNNTDSDDGSSLHDNNNRSSVSTSEDFKVVQDFNNLYAAGRLFQQPSGELRPIAIDGCNVAWGHGNDQEFSYKGIALCADYFRVRGHAVKAFVPRHHQPLIPKEIVDELIKDEILVFTPSRHPGKEGKRIVAYDDRFIVQYAVVTGGVVISNDNFNDLYEEQPAWRDTIRNRVLQHTWISRDILMFQLDPMGRRGHQTLDEFLKFPSSSLDPSSTTPTGSPGAEGPLPGSSKVEVSQLPKDTPKKSEKP